MRDDTAKLLSHLHTGLYRATGGMVGRRLVDNDMLLLTTTGRRTGKPHTVPLLHLTNGDGYVVFASWGGRDQHPEWYQNLLVKPEVVVQVLSRRRRMIARTAGASERSVWWERALDAYDGYAGYQAKTDREIPVVMLDRGDT